MCNKLIKLKRLCSQQTVGTAKLMLRIFLPCPKNKVKVTLFSVTCNQHKCDEWQIFLSRPKIKSVHPLAGTCEQPETATTRVMQGKCDEWQFFFLGQNVKSRWLRSKVAASKAMFYVTRQKCADWSDVTKGTCEQSPFNLIFCQGRKLSVKFTLLCET